MLKGFVFILLILQSFITLGQAGDSNSVDTVKYERLTKFPLASVTYTNYSNSKFESSAGNGKIRMEEVRASLQLAIKVKEKKTYILQKFDFTNFHTTGALNNSQTGFEESLNSFAYSVGLIQVLKNRWKIIAIATPTLASDFREPISSDDFIMQAYFNISKRATPYFEYGFGLVFTTRFGRELVLPVATGIYKKDDWSVFAVLPVQLGIYRHFTNSKLGLSFTANGNFYNFNSNLTPTVKLEKVSYSRLNLGPEYDLKIFKTLHLNLKAGVTLRNRLEPQDKSGSIVLNLSTNEKFFFSAGLNIMM